MSRTTDDLKKLQSDIHGMEMKPLPHLLCVTNLILHGIDMPNVDYTDSSQPRYTSIAQRTGSTSSLPIRPSAAW